MAVEFVRETITKNLAVRYDGEVFRILNLAKHAFGEEEYVVFMSLVDSGVWTMRMADFFGAVWNEEKWVPRFHLAIGQDKEGIVGSNIVSLEDARKIMQETP